MGHRANLVLVENGEHRVFFGHWSSKSLVHGMFWGPEVARAWIVEHREVGDAGWLDDVWAEGGAVLDLDRRVLIVWGGEDLTFDPFQRRVYVGLLREVWAGWEVRWAIHGVIDLAAHVGVPPERVLVPDNPCERRGLVPSEWAGSVCAVASFRFEDGRLVHFPLEGFPLEHIGGVAQVEEARALAGQPIVPTPSELHLTDTPLGGYLVDVAEQRVSLWLGEDLARLHEIVAGWAPYTFVVWDDCGERHLAAAGGTLSFPVPSDDELIRQVSASLLSHSDNQGQAALQALIAEREALGHDVEVNPHALEPTPRPSDAADRPAVLARAITRFRSRRGG